jgi:dimethylamine/trimethylamine dehydrogenase
MGAVLAEALVAHGVEVSIVTPQNMVSAWGVMTAEQYLTQQHLVQLGVQIITAHGLDAFDGSSARLSCVYSERTRNVEADAVVLVTARTPLDGLYKEISGQLESMDSTKSGSVPTLKKIGDCDAPAIIAAAVYAGHKYARELETDVGEVVDVRYDRLLDKD